MSLSRRSLLQRSSAALLTAAVPSSVARAMSRDAQRNLNAANAHGSLSDDNVPALLARALEAARGAGATYADVRLQDVTTEGWGWSEINFRPPYTDRSSGIGIRAHYNGYWGYAASKLSRLTPDTVAVLGREATAQARLGAQGRPRTAELAPISAPASGTWTTPIEIDPFTVSWDEKIDFANGLMRYCDLYPFGLGSQVVLKFMKARQQFASTDGGSYDQLLYRTNVEFRIMVNPHWRTNKGGFRSASSFVSSAGAGWELALNAPFERELPRLVAQANDMRFGVPADVGRYDIVFDGAALAALADVQIGAATELDRAMGYLANSDGTSYINDPLGMAGEYRLGTPLLNVTANRTMRGGTATVQWDDEGVTPDDFVLINDGVLMDFQTTRESASWLAPYYQKVGRPIRSHGGALRNQYIGTEPRQGQHNLVIAPSASNTSFEALCSGVKKGLAVFGGTTRTDQQKLTGESTGELVYEINNGKLGRVVEGAIVMSRSPELWKSLIGVGGAGTVCTLGTESERDSGWAPTHRTVSAPAALFKQVAVTINRVREIP